ncbi:cysteine dioxygenase [Roseomonas fluvialis]|nr:cysteine dioxygenase [Roseomonas fluvialis]
MTDVAPLRDFIRAMTRLANEDASETRWLTEGATLLRGLVADEAWLPDAFAEPGPRYRQYLLHCDPLERFCVVSFVWGPGQRTPIHNHTVWGLVGMLRGEEVSTEMVRGAPMRTGQVDHLKQGEVVAVSADTYDIHVVENALRDRASISIHVYGGNIGAVIRSVFDAATGAEKRFVSGYDNTAVPNLWDRSRDTLAA